MKVLAVIGSNRRPGRVTQMCEHILTVAREQGKEPQNDQLYDYEWSDCLACFDFRSTAGCIQQDDFEILFRKLESADAVILASPVYFGNISGKSD